MALVKINGIEAAKEMVGKTIGPCEWREVTQADIDDFARLSGDDQWIHVDVERAKAESPFGQTIAHGNLTLSMIDGMRLALVETTGFKLGVNYGWNKVRFPAPVPGRLAAARDRRDRLARRDRRRLVSAGHPLHGRGRGEREAVLRGRQRRPGAGRRLAGPRSALTRVDALKNGTLGRVPLRRSQRRRTGPVGATPPPRLSRLLDGERALHAGLAMARDRQ